MDSEPPSECLTPNVTEAQATQLLKDMYGLTVLKLKPLNGYDDKNFHADVKPDHQNPHIERIPCEGYFVKFSNIIESNMPDVLRAQLAEMKHLTQKGIPCQPCVKNLDGDELTDCHVVNPDGTELVHKMSVREFLPGKVIDTITMKPRYLYDVGVFVARTTKALEDFYSAAYDSFDPRWSLNNVLEVGKITFVIKDEKHRRICEEVLKAFEDEVIPAKPGFRKGQIHGDINEQNLLVSTTAEDSETLTITGLIDFQDSARTFVIYDLALATCYMMTMAKMDCRRLDIPGHMLAGYSSLLNLTEAERKTFRTLVASRLVMSLVYGAYTHHLDPSNEYALTTAKAGWDALVLLWETPEDIAWKSWSGIISSYKT